MSTLNFLISAKRDISGQPLLQTLSSRSHNRLLLSCVHLPNYLRSGQLLQLQRMLKRWAYHCKL